jgi:hypothetical protein
LFLAEQALYMERDGVIHQVSYKGFLDAALSVVATPGGRVLWSGIRNVIGDDISNYIDDELERRAPDAPDWTTLLPHWREGLSADPTKAV